MSIIKEQKLRAKWSEDLYRRENILKAVDYFSSNQEYYLRKAIKKNYPNSYSDMYPYLDYINLTEDVITQISQLFTNAPALSIIRDDEVVEDIQDNFNILAQDSQLTATLQKVNELTNLTRKVGVIPHWDSGKVDLEILTADRVFVEQNDINPKRADAVWIQVGLTINDPQKLDAVNEYIRWTPEAQERYEINNENFGEPKLIESNPNPYGVIPIVWFTNDIELDSFWFDATNYLVEKNEIFNQDLSALRFSSALQSFSTLVLEGFDPKDTIKMGVHRPIVIPPSDLDKQNGKVYYINPNADLTKILEYIDRRIISVINSLGISASSYRKDSSSFSSGYQLKLSKIDVVKRNEADRVYYLDPVKRICKLMMQCYTLNHETKRFPDDIDIRVDFAEVEVDVNPIEAEQVNAARIANGLTSRPRILKEENPDLTLEQAKELYSEIKAENSEFIPGTGLNEIEVE